MLSQSLNICSDDNNTNKVKNPGKIITIKLNLKKKTQNISLIEPAPNFFRYS